MLGGQPISMIQRVDDADGGAPVAMGNMPQFDVLPRANIDDRNKNNAKEFVNIDVNLNGNKENALLPLGQTKESNIVRSGNEIHLYANTDPKNEILNGVPIEYMKGGQPTEKIGQQPLLDVLENQQRAQVQEEQQALPIEDNSVIPNRVTQGVSDMLIDETGSQNNVIAEDNNPPIIQGAQRTGLKDGLVDLSRLQQQEALLQQQHLNNRNALQPIHKNIVFNEAEANRALLPNGAVKQYVETSESLVQEEKQPLLSQARPLITAQQQVVGPILTAVRDRYNQPQNERIVQNERLVPTNQIVQKDPEYPRAATVLNREHDPLYVSFTQERAQQQSQQHLRRLEEEQRAQERAEEQQRAEVARQRAQEQAEAAREREEERERALVARERASEHARQEEQEREREAEEREREREKEVRDKNRNFEIIDNQGTVEEEKPTVTHIWKKDDDYSNAYRRHHQTNVNSNTRARYDPVQSFLKEKQFLGRRKYTTNNKRLSSYQRAPLISRKYAKHLINDESSRLEEKYIQDRNGKSQLEMALQENGESEPRHSSIMDGNLGYRDVNANTRTAQYIEQKQSRYPTRALSMNAPQKPIEYTENVKDISPQEFRSLTSLSGTSDLNPQEDISFREYNQLINSNEELPSQEVRALRELTHLSGIDEPLPVRETNDLIGRTQILSRRNVMPPGGPLGKKPANKERVMERLKALAALGDRLDQTRNTTQFSRIAQIVRDYLHRYNSSENKMDVVHQTINKTVEQGDKRFVTVYNNGTKIYKKKDGSKNESVTTDATSDLNKESNDLEDPGDMGGLEKEKNYKQENSTSDEKETKKTEDNVKDLKSEKEKTKEEGKEKDEKSLEESKDEGKTKDEKSLYEQKNEKLIEKAKEENALKDEKSTGEAKDEDKTKEESKVKDEKPLEEEKDANKMKDEKLAEEVKEKNELKDDGKDKTKDEDKTKVENLAEEEKNKENEMSTKEHNVDEGKNSSKNSSEAEESASWHSLKIAALTALRAAYEHEKQVNHSKSELDQIDHISDALRRTNNDSVISLVGEEIMSIKKDEAKNRVEAETGHKGGGGKKHEIIRYKEILRENLSQALREMVPSYQGPSVDSNANTSTSRTDLEASNSSNDSSKPLKEDSNNIQNSKATLPGNNNLTTNSTSNSSTEMKEMMTHVSQNTDESDSSPPTDKDVSDKITGGSSSNEIFSKLVEQKIDDAHSKEKSNASLIEDSARSDPDEPEYTNPDKQSLILLKDLGEKTQHSIEHASVDKQNNTFDLFLPSKTDDIEDLIHENEQKSKKNSTATDSIKSGENEINVKNNSSIFEADDVKNKVDQNSDVKNNEEKSEKDHASNASIQKEEKGKENNSTSVMDKQNKDEKSDDVFTKDDDKKLSVENHEGKEDKNDSSDPPKEEAKTLTKAEEGRVPPSEFEKGEVKKLMLKMERDKNKESHKEDEKKVENSSNEEKNNGTSSILKEKEKESTNVEKNNSENIDEKKDTKKIKEGNDEISLENKEIQSLEKDLKEKENEELNSASENIEVKKHKEQMFKVKSMLDEEENKLRSSLIRKVDAIMQQYKEEREQFEKEKGIRPVAKGLENEEKVLTSHHRIRKFSNANEDDEHLLPKSGAKFPLAKDLFIEK